ncbi:hypothetical protein SDC9_153401 [bioreactor metagenome]|uniref:Uncharacterized protein n=1 Tax=bioreactor metagenome TaxID=1076179 RepID=A0A645EVU9_9ZZZZ
MVRELGFPGFHRTAGNEDHRNVQTQGSHQHPWGDFVAVGDTDHCIGTMGIHHVLHRISDQLARRQGELHAIMPHGDAVIHTDGIELKRHSAGSPHGFFDLFSEALQMNMAGNDIHIRIHDGDKWLLHIRIADTGGLE